MRDTNASNLLLIVAIVSIVIVMVLLNVDAESSIVFAWVIGVEVLMFVALDGGLETGLNLKEGVVCSPMVGIESSSYGDGLVWFFSDLNSS